MAPEDVLNSVDESRREFLKKVIGGTVFAVPMMASFSMDGLSLDAAEASFANQLSNVQVIPISPRKINDVPTYQAKFICGTNLGSSPSLARGTYFTSINVRNTRGKSLTFTQKVVQTLGGSNISNPTNHTLDPETGVEIHCSQILGAIGNPSGLVEGFVVITTPDEKLNALEVVAVYTGQSV